MASGAEHLASIYGTEKDKVNCSFYFKIGACRHGDRCSRKHVKPTFSQTVLIPNVYRNPSHESPGISEQDLQEHFDLFYQDFFIELALKFGEIEEMNVCDNLGDHLVGNVYVRFKWEEDAGKCVDALNKRFYAGRPLYAELSPVTDFREACCRQYENSECTFGGFCNFMHLKHVSAELRRRLLSAQRLYIQDKRRKGIPTGPTTDFGGVKQEGDYGTQQNQEDSKDSNAAPHLSRQSSPDRRREPSDSTQPDGQIPIKAEPRGPDGKDTSDTQPPTPKVPNGSATPEREHNRQRDGGTTPMGAESQTSQDARNPRDPRDPRNSRDPRLRQQTAIATASTESGEPEIKKEQ